MDTKNMQITPMNGKQFLEMLSTVSLEEILGFEFRLNPTKKWELLITPTNPLWKYHCNICRVVQFGDKNLFSHLSGKKHSSAMNAEQKLQIRMKPSEGPQKSVPGPIKKGPNTNVNNNKGSPAPVVKAGVAANKNNLSNAAVKQEGENYSVLKAKGLQINSPTIGVNAQKKESNIPGNNKTVQKNLTGNNTPSQKTIPETPQAIQKNIPRSNPPTQKNMSGNKQPIQKTIPVLGAANTQKKPNPNLGNNQVKKPVGVAASPKNPVIKKGPQAATPSSTGPANIVKNSGSPVPKTTATNATPAAKPVGKPGPKPAAKPIAKPVPNSQPLPKVQPQTQTPKQAPPQTPNQTQPPKQQQPPTQSQPQTKPQANKSLPNAKANNTEMNRDKASNPDIVKNPLATKITCVPLAKLISPTPEPEAEADVIIIDEPPKEPPKEVDKQPEPAINPIPIQTTTKPINSNVPKKPTKTVAPPSRPNVNKTITPSYGAPKDYHPPARVPGETFESRNLNHVMGLVGVEYVLKIVRNLSDRNPRYQCCLCEITADEQSMHNHLLGYNHRLKYFDKHFPTAMRQYRQYVSNVPEGEVCKIMMPVFDKLATAIETHHGRKTSHLCYEHVYAKDRQALFSEVYNRKHSSEKMGPSFTHVVDAREVDELIEKARNNALPVMNMENPNPYYPTPYAAQGANNYMGYRNAIPKNPSQTVDDETHKRMVENFLRDNRQNIAEVQKSRNPKRNRSRSNSPEQRKRHAQKRHWNVERRSVSPLRDGDLWQAYRHMVDLKVRELNVSFDSYKSDPEQHPSYQTEWQMFWKRRKDELIQAGINHRTYNFQNEWIHFFNARIEELYNQDIENIKIKCRERLCLPMTNDELENEKYHVHLPTPTVEPSISKPESVKGPEKMSVDEEPPNVIHVLRLLTALENYLGSLGSLITDMLVKALQTQKIFPEKVHTSILTAENCAILETVKEKFTGLLISQIYDPTKERALKKAINDTELLLQEASKYNTPKPNPQQAEEQDFPMANVAGPSTKKPLDKTELAAKLASSLMSQGKTSINREELQKILQVYTMIEQKKRIEEPNANSMNAGPSTLPNSNSNGNLLTQHSTRNSNIASSSNNAGNVTSMYTGQNYSGNVARFNNQPNTNITNSSIAYPTDRGFGGYQNNQFGPGGPGGYQNNQFGSGAPLLPPSGVLRNDLATSSLFNFNTNLNPTYNNNNLNRRNTNF
ncbi:uncharacterized protein LOC108095836 [Drosophila ficusphila]|uniref:uncharacterized protein LOC108095836 n=1 Tax=Drosophila ficusphila TaxID=30025 RepID=UPI0007E6DD3F|nr:uncharacterized protein LOC108095836 [Drosophila ficusphila]